jgi:hypothetical protein
MELEEIADVRADAVAVLFAVANFLMMLAVLILLKVLRIMISYTM